MKHISALLALCLLAPLGAHAAALSPGDAAFVAKVSQGGMFEVESSKLATQKAGAQNVKDVATYEVHDHQLVGDKLRAIAATKGITLGTELRPPFTQKMARLQSLSGAVGGVDAVHLGDVGVVEGGAAFAKEAMLAQDPDLKAFAAETSLIVKRHIGALHAPGTESK